MKPIHISFDFGATITRAPELFARWAHTIIRGGGQVSMITTVAFVDGKPTVEESTPRENWLDEFQLRQHVKIFYCDHGKLTRKKADECKFQGVDMHVDNSHTQCEEVNKRGILALGVGTMMWKYKRELDDLKHLRTTKH